MSEIKKPITMANGTYPISSQQDAKDAWDLRGRSKAYSEAQVVAHIRLACSKLGLSFPGGADDNERQQAASQQQDFSMRPHGFIYPSGLPECSVCGMPPSDTVHVNTAGNNASMNMFLGSALAGTRSMAADHAANRDRRMGAVRRSHAYAASSTALDNLRCVGCGQSMGAAVHVAGMPVGGFGGSMPGPSGTWGAVQTAADELTKTGPGVGQAGYGEIVLVRHAFKALPGEASVDPDYKLCALCGFAQDDEVHAYSEPDEPGGDDNEPDFVKVTRLPNQTAWLEVAERVAARPGANEGSQRQQAFVAQLNGKLIVAGPASTLTEPDDSMPRELAAMWEKASAQNPHFMWIEGRFVEADRPNRNKAAWSSQDLEMGEPTVAHGPLNWLHEERHIIGAIAAAKLVQVTDKQRQAAADFGQEIPNNHIRALSPVWRYLYPQEARQIAMYSDQGKLWYSMECISREVACLAPGCNHSQPYGEYMMAPYTRCRHVKEGGNRRFADPSFLGGAVIVPPVRPGWGGANASVMRQAAALAEGQEGAFDGLTTSEAEQMVAQIIQHAGGTA